jgi:beta-xylosidase
VYVNGTYFMYGEYYGRGPYIVTGNELFPKLSVYTSTDMVTWNYGGLLHNNSKGVEGAPPVWSESPHWKYHPKGTWWSPSAVYDKRSDSIIIWFSASPGECCSAYFGIAKSRNGVNFELVSLSETPATNVSVDGSSVLIDDDGEGYVAYTAMGVPGQDAHVVAIDKLTDDYLGTAKTQVGNFFPDPFVEGVMLFKRKGVYYLLYGSCCCACREGSGAVVHMAKDIAGPWTRQPGGDMNCKAGEDVKVCAGMPAGAKRDRPTGELIINAQGIGLSVLPTSSTGEENTYLWMGSRWLSAPHNNPKCTSLCSTCERDHGFNGYVRGNDFEYWIPLEFNDKTGYVHKFKNFVNSYQLEIP